MCWGSFCLSLKCFWSFCGLYVWFLLHGYRDLGLRTLDRQTSVAQGGLHLVGRLFLFRGIHCFFHWLWPLERLDSKRSFRDSLDHYTMSSKSEWWGQWLKGGGPKAWEKQVHYHGYCRAQDWKVVYVFMEDGGWKMTVTPSLNSVTRR